MSEEKEYNLADFDDFESEDEDEPSEELPDELIIPTKKITKDELLEKFPTGLILELHVFCEKCKTLHDATLDPSALSDADISLIYSVDWRPKLRLTEDVPDVDLEDAIEATINIVQVAPALSILAALEGKKSCLSSRIHTYLKTQPGYLKQLSDKRAVATLAATANNLSFCLTSNVVSAAAQNVRTIGYLFVSEDTIDEIDGKIKKHKNV
jgi:hypothetical protein